MKVPELSVEGWAKLVGAISATIALILTLWKPVKRTFRRNVDEIVTASLLRSRKTIRRMLREDILPEDFTNFDRIVDNVDTNNDRLTMVETALKAQGAALAELPKIAGQMEGLPRAIETLSTAMRDMSENIGFIRGRMEERERWTGEERRHEDRPVPNDRRRRS